MEKEIEIFRKTRTFLLSILSELTTEQLNQIPPGFNNNIVWNLGHLVAAQQGVCYVRGGLPMVVNEKYFLAYKPESRPSGFVEEAEIEILKRQLLSTIDKLEEDLAARVFATNPPWTNRYGVEHATIEDSIRFLLFHDGLHIGYIMALKRVVSS
ncbi:MAG TPA: DinB family protein [Flavisolibacter sp.]|jgi:hypothetical protein|nr:DinB family protein [Flavisolibacter sp.]